MNNELELKVGEWQPIATAPLTGHKVLLHYRNREGYPRTVVARYCDEEAVVEIDLDDVGLEPGWYECIDNWDDYCSVAITEGQPSHWMPLPPPPAVEAQP